MYGNSNVRLPFFPVSHVSGSYPTLRSTRTPPASSTPRKPIGFKVQSTGTPRKLNASIIELEAQLAHVNVHLRDERSAPEQDLIDYRAGLLHPRTELYSEMLRGVRHQQRAMVDFRITQKLEARHQRFYALLADIGIPRSTVDLISQVI